LSENDPSVYPVTVFEKDGIKLVVFDWAFANKNDPVLLQLKAHSGQVLASIDARRNLLLNAAHFIEANPAVSYVSMDLLDLDALYLKGHERSIPIKELDKKGWHFLPSSVDLVSRKFPFLWSYSLELSRVMMPSFNPSGPLQLSLNLRSGHDDNPLVATILLDLGKEFTWETQS
jgi:hypothetical protein